MKFFSLSFSKISNFYASDTELFFGDDRIVPPGLPLTGGPGSSSWSSSDASTSMGDPEAAEVMRLRPRPRSSCSPLYTSSSPP